MYVSNRVEKEYINFLLHPAFVNSIWNEEGLPQQWKESTTIPAYIRSVIKLIEVIVAAYHCYQLHTKFYPASFSEG
jgi:hypothetical protein